MIEVKKPNTNFLRGALPTVEQNEVIYKKSIFSEAGLSYVTIIKTLEALDAIEENLPHLLRYEARRAFNTLMGTQQKTGEIDRLRMNINDKMYYSKDEAWIQDFGNIAYGKFQPTLERLQNAIANNLGRFKRMPDRNTLACLIVAQALANESAVSVEQYADHFKDYKMEMHDGMTFSVAYIFRELSCAPINRQLVILIDKLIHPYVDFAADILDDQSVRTGVQALVNVLESPQLWEDSRKRACELNGWDIGKEQEQ